MAPSLLHVENGQPFVGDIPIHPYLYWALEVQVMEGPAYWKRGEYIYIAHSIILDKIGVQKRKP